MFTQCPKCKTVFRIYAEQLAQAHGQVRCGICEHSFNSLKNLAESLSGFNAPAPAVAETTNALEQAGRVEDGAHPAAEEESLEAEQAEAGTAEIKTTEALQQAEPVEYGAHPSPAEGVVTEQSFESRAAGTESAATTPSETIEQAEPVENDIHPSHAEIAAMEQHSIAGTDEIEADTPPLTPLEPAGTGFTVLPNRSSVTAQVSSDDVSVTAISAEPEELAIAPPPTQAEVNHIPGAPFSAKPDNALPDLGIIAAEPRRISATTAHTGWLKTSVWTVMNITLIMCLLGQYIYFNRNDLSQYPELRPWLTRFCAVMSCNTPMRRDVSQINLANRVVQSHPSQANALLIDVTLVNEADFSQPYPLLEIRFSDLNNRLVAGRRFRPAEYLPTDASAQAGMPPHQPVHITLEIVDPGKDAVSFQFELL